MRTTIILFALLAGIFLRVVNPSDMEFKSDEIYMADRVAGLSTEPVPLLGLPSGVILKNPGASVWVFLALSKLTGVRSPIGLVQCVQILNSLALVLFLLLAFKKFRGPEWDHWAWGIALASVNPIWVLYQRKIWAQSVLPIFTLLFLWSYWNKKKSWGSFFWGFFTLFLGQIHMSGFFFSAAFGIRSLILKEIRFKSFILGAVFGLIPLIPWLLHLKDYLFLQNRAALTYGLGEAIQFKFWVFWLSTSFGLHLGNTLGVHAGNSLPAQLADFFKYPYLLGYPSYLNAIAHLFVLFAAFFILIRWRPRSYLLDTTHSTLQSGFWGFGALLTLFMIVIRKYYLLVSFPLESVWLSRVALRYPDRKVYRVLTLLLITNLWISIQFLSYVHKNFGSKSGDYGCSYRGQMQGRCIK